MKLKFDVVRVSHHSMSARFIVGTYQQELLPCRLEVMRVST